MAENIIGASDPETATLLRDLAATATQVYLPDATVFGKAPRLLQINDELIRLTDASRHKRDQSLNTTVAITATATSITVSDEAQFWADPAANPPITDLITIDGESMTATQKLGAGVVTVTRAAPVVHTAASYPITFRQDAQYDLGTITRGVLGTTAATHRNTSVATIHVTQADFASVAEMRTIVNVRWFIRTDVDFTIVFKESVSRLELFTSGFGRAFMFAAPADARLYYEVRDAPTLGYTEMTITRQVTGAGAPLSVAQMSASSLSLAGAGLLVGTDFRPRWDAYTATTEFAHRDEGTYHSIRLIQGGTYLVQPALYG